MQNEQIIDGVTYLVTYVKKEDNQKKQSRRGNGFYFFDDYGDIGKDTVNLRDKRKAFCYPTKADCIKARDKILALYRIKSYCDEQWGEFIPDWSNEDDEKYYIGYSHITKKYFIDNNNRYQNINVMYLASFEHCKEIIEKFKDDLDILFDKVP